MADINDFMGDSKFELTKQEKNLMDIFASCWEHCHSSHCRKCKFNQGNDMFSLLLCLSYQYAQELIANGYKKVRHGTWIANRSPIEVEFSCSECGFSYIEADSYQECDHNFCPKCGARMDGKE